MQRNDVIFAMY